MATLLHACANRTIQYWKTTTYMLEWYIQVAQNTSLHVNYVEAWNVTGEENKYE